MTAAAAFVVRMLPYFRRAARRYAPRVWAEPDDLLGDMVAVALARHPVEYDPAKGLLDVQYARHWVLKAVVEATRVRDRVCPPATGRRVPLRGGAADRGDPAADPTAPAELADDVARLAVLLDRLPAGRRAAVVARFGLGGADPLTGAALAAALGVANHGTAGGRVLAGLRELAARFGLDPARAGVDPGEGRAAGVRRAWAARTDPGEGRSIGRRRGLAAVAESGTVT